MRFFNKSLKNCEDYNKICGPYKYKQGTDNLSKKNSTEINEARQRKGNNHYSQTKTAR